MEHVRHLCVLGICVSCPVALQDAYPYPVVNVEPSRGHFVVLEQEVAVCSVFEIQVCVVPSLGKGFSYKLPELRDSDSEPVEKI